MAINPPFTDLTIKKSKTGFYEGYSLPIALISKFSMALLVIWALVWPANANGAIIGASNTAKLFVTLGQMLSGGLLSTITVMCVVLIMTFLVTSADSGILVMNTIMSGGAQETGIKHRIVWGVILTLVIGALLLAAGKADGTADPLGALRSAMIIGALPFTICSGSQSKCGEIANRAIFGSD